MNFDPTTLRRLADLQSKLDHAESRLRGLAGKLRNRTGPSGGNSPACETRAIEEELLSILADDLQPPIRAALNEVESRLRKQALIHFQKTKVDPQLWKDLASSS